MLWLPLLAAAGAGYVFYNERASRGSTSPWCYGSICWLCDKAPECVDELRTIRSLSQSGSKAYRLDPVLTAASYLNRSFIRPAYRSRDFLVEHSDVRENTARIFVSFDDSTHMAFELYRPCLDGCQDIWAVSRYAYLDENPNLGCGCGC